MLNGKMTVEEIKKFMGWGFYKGFTADSCSCGTKINILVGTPGWTCTCGVYNTLSNNETFKPWEKPDIGPAAGVIRQAQMQKNNETNKK